MMRLTDSLIRSAAAVGEQCMQWLSVAVERATDSEAFFAAEQTPFEVLLDDGLMRLRYYPPLEHDHITAGKQELAVARREHAVPLLLVPPLAASTMIFDLLPHRSLVRYLRARGFAVYLVDWGDPDADDVHLGLRHYCTEKLPAAVAALRAHSGRQELSLLGYCMGGLFALIYAGWARDPSIRNLVTIASPVDYHEMGAAGELLQRLRLPTRLVRRFTGFRVHNINPKYLRVPGFAASLAFKLTNPKGTLAAYIDLLMNLGDREYVVEHATTAAWFNRMHDYPGGIVQDFIVRVGLDNALARGEIPLGEERSSLLRGLDCNILAIAGATDRIVPEASARHVLEVVASGDKDFRVAPGGHAGVFGGARAPETTWRWAADWLGPRSRTAADQAA
jgi:polyhydroxyalkanoate synthase